MRLHLCVVLALAALVPALLPASASAQTATRVPLTDADRDARPPGWSVTPALSIGTLWDDNVLFDDAEGARVRDGLTIVRPGVALDFRGRRGDFSARYDGGFVRHHDLASLDGFEQRFAATGRRELSRRTAIFFRHHGAAQPTTALTELAGVPFARIGSRIQDLRGGAELALTPRTEATVSYRLHWVDFDRQAPASSALVGGLSHGATLALTRAAGRRSALTADYSVERASLADGERFTIQTAWGGAEHRFTDRFRAFASAGVSHLGFAAGSRLGPAWRAGLARDGRQAQVVLLYTRSFVPSYGFGGTTENEDLTARVHLPLGRRLSWQTVAALRRNEPLTPGDPSLETLWVENAVGFAFARWMRLEAFVANTHQTIDRPGGVLDRLQYGLQITTATTARIR